MSSQQTKLVKCILGKYFIMTKLLHISSNSFPPLETEHATKMIWREMAKDFDEYHIIARGFDNKFHHYQDNNIYLHLVPKLYKSRSFIFTSFYMIRLIRKFKINILLAQCPIFGGSLATLLSMILKIPLMIELHGLEYFKILDSNKSINKLLSILIKFSLNNATKIRSLSSRMTSMLVDRGIRGNIVEIPNRVDLGIFNNPKQSNTISKPVKVISVGRFVWEKGYEQAINAILSLQNRFNIELTLIGGGPLRDKYNKMIGSNKGIHLIDWIAQEEFVPLLRSSDIYIQPSISEGMPRAILEAMALKLPVISSDVGAISGVIENMWNGLLIEVNDIEGLMSSIEKLILDDDLRTKLANNGYNEVVCKYDWTKVFALYKQELKNMLVY